MAGNCRTCRYWVFGSRTGPHFDFQNKRDPHESERGQKRGECRIYSVAPFPIRDESEWCGEHKERQQRGAGDAL